MKQKDIALVLVMAAVAAVLSLIISRFLFSTPESRNQTAEVVDVISSDFTTPPPKYFNSTAVNPAQPIPLDSGNKQ
jgi:hypothetical protein